MKKTKKLLGMAIIVIIVGTVFCGCKENRKHGETAGREAIRVSGAWALYPMMIVWADEYEKSHAVTIEVSGGGAGKGMSDVLNKQVDIGMVSRPIRGEELERGVFYIAVTKDAVVATINANNPVLDEISKQGLSREDLKKIFMREVTHWGEIVGKSIKDDKIVVYGRSDASGAAKVWASFLGDYTQSDCQNKADANFDGDQSLTHAVGREENAIGFNNLNYAYNMETGSFAEGIRPVMLDLNGNNILDPDENFYDNREQLAQNVSLGNYPSPPARLEYVVSNGPFTGEVKKFIDWILTEGQAFVIENGYVKLTDEQQERERMYLKLESRK